MSLREVASWRALGASRAPERELSAADAPSRPGFERALAARRREASEQRAALGAALGLADEALLGRLVELDVRGSTALAFWLAPLVEVAWADGRVDPEERVALERVASDLGLWRGTPARAQLEAWLDEAPPPALYAAWHRYLRLVRARGGRGLVDRARTVAEAAGGPLRGERNAAREARVLRRLEASFVAAQAPRRARIRGASTSPAEGRSS